MLNAVIFDFDGIIVDSEPMHYEAFQRVLEPLGLGYSWEEYCKTYIGYDDRDALREVFRRKGENIDSLEIQRLISEKAEVFHQFVHDGRADPLPGAVELILSLHRAIPLGLCSGALRMDLLPILGKLGIENAFSTIVTAEETEKSKPDPAPYALVLENLDLRDAATVIAIEDTPAGILSARNAGLRVLAVTNSYDREYLLEADVVIDSLEHTTRLSLDNMVP